MVGRKPGKLVGLSPSGVRISLSASYFLRNSEYKFLNIFIYISALCSNTRSSIIFPFNLAGMHIESKASEDKIIYW